MDITKIARLIDGEMPRLWTQVLTGPFLLEYSAMNKKLAQHDINWRDVTEFWQETKTMYDEQRHRAVQNFAKDCLGKDKAMVERMLRVTGLKNFLHDIALERVDYRMGNVEEYTEIDAAIEISARLQSVARLGEKAADVVAKRFVAAVDKIIDKEMARGVSR